MGTHQTLSGVQSLNGRALAQNDGGGKGGPGKGCADPSLLGALPNSLGVLPSPLGALFLALVVPAANPIHHPLTVASYVQI